MSCSVTVSPAPLGTLRRFRSWGTATKLVFFFENVLFVS
jgi:hypothetical protein